MHRLAELASREIPPTVASDWNTAVCYLFQCGWKLPTCSTQFFILDYHGYYLEASQCGCSGVIGFNGPLPPPPPPGKPEGNESP